MTDISVQTQSFQVEKRGWLRGPHGTGPGDNPSATLDLSLFTANTHYPDGFIPSGTVLGKVTATGFYGPHDEAATDGREVARGLQFATVKATARPATSLVVHGFVDTTRLPVQSGPGSFTAKAATDLTHVVTD